MNNSVLSILRTRGFFEDLQILCNVLKPLKEATICVEAKTTNMADCYLQLCRVGAAIKNLPENDAPEFRQYCINTFNKRWHEFAEFEGYLLCYYLHPKYRGNENII